MAGEKFAIFGSQTMPAGQEDCGGIQLPCPSGTQSVGPDVVPLPVCGSSGWPKRGSLSLYMATLYCWRNEANELYGVGACKAGVIGSIGATLGWADSADCILFAAGAAVARPVTFGSFANRFW